MKKDHLFDLIIKIGLLLLTVIFLFKAITGTMILGWFCLVFWFLFIIINNSFRHFLVGSIFIAFSGGIIVIFPLYFLEGWWWVSESTFWTQNKNIIWDSLVTILTMIPSLLTILLPGYFLFLKRQYFFESEKKFFLLALLFGSSWISIEALREMFLNGLTWGHIGYLVSDIFFIQWASVGGVYLLSFLVIIVNLYICRFLLSLDLVKDLLNKNFKNKLPKERMGDIKKYPVFLFLLLIIYGFGFIRLGLSEETSPNMSIAVVASSYTTEEFWNPNYYEKLIIALRSTLEKETIEVMIFPENIFPFIVLNIKNSEPLQQGGYINEIAFFKSLRDLSIENPKTTFLIGLHTFDSLPKKQNPLSGEKMSLENPKKHPDSRYFNSLVVLENGEIKDMYHKRNLLFFSEKPPAFLEENHVRVFTRGEKIGVKTKHGDFGVFICSEISSSLYSKIPKDAKLLVIPSNDSLLLHPQAAKYHHLMTRVKAVTHSTPVARSVKGGISSIIDSNGRVIKKIDLSETKSVDVKTIEMVLFKTK